MRPKLPLLFTLGNALCGIAAMALALEGKMIIPLLLVLTGAVLDTLDGFLARRWHSDSALGANADVVSDLITFGAAPAVLLAKVSGGTAGYVVAALYGAAIVFRLIRFRVAPTPAFGFLGMPSPMSALGAVAGTILGAGLPGVPLLGEALVLLFGALAASRLPYPRWNHPALARLPIWFWVVLYGAHGAIFVFRPQVGVFSLMLVYTVVAPILMARYRAKHDAVNGAGAAGP